MHCVPKPMAQTALRAVITAASSGASDVHGFDVHNVVSKTCLLLKPESIATRTYLSGGPGRLGA